MQVKKKSRSCGYDYGGPVVCITVWLLEGLGSITAKANFAMLFFDIAILLVAE
jgi:hypothetical protein